MNDWILYNVENHIATVTINRPEKRNAMTYAMLGDFIETMARAGADDEVRVVILTGTAGAFCAGTDLSDLDTVPGETRGLRGSAAEKSRWWPIVSCPKPVIAAIDGPPLVWVRNSPANVIFGLLPLGLGLPGILRIADWCLIPARGVGCCRG